MRGNVCSLGQTKTYLNINKRSKALECFSCLLIKFARNRPPAMHTVYCGHRVICCINFYCVQNRFSYLKKLGQYFSHTLKLLMELLQDCL